MPKISVIMPVYNTKEEWLREAIDSILAQTYTDFEFLILNDGSTNNAEEVIKSYSDKRIKYFYKENSGIADTLNFGLTKAKGEYIARMDSDDISLPTRFAKQVDFLDKNTDISLVGTQYETFPSKFRPNLPLTVGILDMLEFSAVAHATIMYRKADFEKYDLKYNPNFVPAEDLELWCRALNFVKFANIEDMLYLYRRNSDGLSISRSDEQINLTNKILYSLINNQTTNPKLRKILYGFAQKKTTYRKIQLFGFLPLFKIKNKGGKETWYLFNFIPFLKIRG